MDILRILRWSSVGDVLFHSQIVALSTAESEYISITKDAAHALEVRSAMAEWGLSPKVVSEKDASAGRAVTTRRGVGRVRYVGVRWLWLQQLCAEGVVEMRTKAGEHSEADLGTKCRLEADDLSFKCRRHFDRRWDGAHV